MKKVLVIHDSRFQSIIICDMLKDLGYESKASSETVAFIELEKFNPDIVIVNLVMKKITGDLMIEKIKEFKPDVKAIITSTNHIKLSDYKKIDGIIHAPINNDKLIRTMKILELSEHLKIDDLQNKKEKNKRKNELKIELNISKEENLNVEYTAEEKETLKVMDLSEEKEVLKVEDTSKKRKTSKATGAFEVKETLKNKLDKEVEMEQKIEVELKYKFCPYCGRKLSNEEEDARSCGKCI